MKKSFQINNKSEILIYGAAAIGLIVYDICKEIEMPVLGFMDKRGDEISQLQGLKVWSIGGDLQEINKEVIVFIAVKNVFEHDNIVRKLLEMGFHNIIYRPYSVIKGGGTEEEKFLNEIYDKFMNHELGNLININVPQTTEVGRYIFKDYSLIKDNDTHKIVYVPLECVYTDNKRIPNVFNWADLPIMALVPHIGFFKWLDGQEGFSYQSYMDFCVTSAQKVSQIEITERWKENVIRNRSDVFNNMNLSIERDYDFFVRNAPAGEWNTGGYFNLRSGKHRAAFFMAKGRQYFPLKISEDDYEAWVSREALNRFVNQFSEIDFPECHAPAEHPYFYDMKCDNRIFYYRLLSSFVYYIASQQYDLEQHIALEQNGGVIISLNDDGYMARNLQKCGMGVEVYNKSILGEMLDDLLLVKEQRAQDVAYAIIEYRFGTEICYRELVERNLGFMVVIVCARDLEEFGKERQGKLKVIRVCDGYKDGECVKIYWLERNDL